MSLRRSTRFSSGGVTTSIPKLEPAEDGAPTTSTTASMPPPPSTPRKRRKLSPSATPTKPPPMTPTPSAIGFMTAPPITASILDDPPSPSRKRPSRPAEPHMTNAPLSTPRGSKVLAKPIQPVDWKGSADDATTTENLLEKACAHLVAVDPRLQAVVDAHPCRVFSPEGLAEVVEPFASLSSGIMAQQVSGAAAKSIKGKFVALFGEEGRFPTPARVASMDVAELRTAGLSGRKAEYIKGLAERFESGELTAKMLVEASDEEVLEKLTAVRGLGRWSVEMFACFGLKRMDILSTGDLGVQRGMAALAGRDVAKLKAKGGGKWKYMSEKDMLDNSAKFSPYRSLFMWYMWRIEGVNVEAMESK